MRVETAMRMKTNRALCDFIFMVNKANLEQFARKNMKKKIFLNSPISVLGYGALTIIITVIIN